MGFTDGIFPDAWSRRLSGKDPPVFGLHAQVSDHEIRLAALESRTVSGVPETTIAVRFTTLHERVDAVANNLLDKIDARFNQLSAQTDARFEQVDQRFAQMDQRFEQVDQRFAQMDQRFEQVDQRFAQMDGQLGEIKSMLLSLGATAPTDRVN
jgi:septal ring factor EnvC (AmiA/AmiB activator)